MCQSSGIEELSSSELSIIPSVVEGDTVNKKLTVKSIPEGCHECLLPKALIMDAIIKFLRYLLGRDDVGSSFPGRGEDSGQTRKRERSPCDEEVQERPQKRRKEDRSLQQEEMAVFFRVLEDSNIRTFLAIDSCMRISDKYLLAMVFIYFIRAGLQTEEYHKNFFPAL
ncbi:speedy protein 1-A-like [Eleutherodactylus coqui]|uniref:speedy protein 1-A-like n=1 Tax=Eleutherodactylus coqui TaxID=57060 RepID=UPI0034628B32